MKWMDFVGFPCWLFFRYVLPAVATFAYFAGLTWMAHESYWLSPSLQPSMGWWESFGAAVSVGFFVPLLLYTVLAHAWQDYEIWRIVHSQKVQDKVNALRKGRFR